MVNNADAATNMTITSVDAFKTAPDLGCVVSMWAAATPGFDAYEIGRLHPSTTAAGSESQPDIRVTPLMFQRPISREYTHVMVVALTDNGRAFLELMGGS